MQKNKKNKKKNNNNNKAVAFKSNAPFINCISKINDIKIDNAEDLDAEMPIYNLKQALQEILIMLVMVKKGMMQIKLVKMKLKLLFH